ncbi:MAG: flagellar motor switch protein FliN [Firmicutes bacterium]|nr:flagellar motor switch protein FliN [Bacillota bacterium]
MKSSILSQGEIEALLHSNSSQSPSDGLLNLFSAAAGSTATWISGLSPGQMELEGPYFERLKKGLAESIAQNAVVVAADVDGQELVFVMSLADAQVLAQRLGASPLETAQMMGQNWVSHMAELVGVPYIVYQAQEVDLGLFSLPAKGARTYLVRNLLLYGGRGLEFCVVVPDLDKFEPLAKRIATGSKPSSQGRASMGSKLLKGPTSPVTKAVFTPIDELPLLEKEQEINLLEDIDLLVTVELGHTTLTLNEILELKKQSVIRLERHAGEPVDVYINNNPTAKGEVVVLEENFGVRILEILPKSQRLRE